MTYIAVKCLFGYSCYANTEYCQNISKEFNWWNMLLMNFWNVPLSRHNEMMMHCSQDICFRIKTKCCSASEVAAMYNNNDFSYLHCFLTVVLSLEHLNIVVVILFSWQKHFNRVFQIENEYINLICFHVLTGSMALYLIFFFQVVPKPIFSFV